VENEVEVPVTRHRQPLAVTDDEVRLLRSWQTLISDVGVIAEGMPRRATVPDHGCSAKTLRRENGGHDVGKKTRLRGGKLQNTSSGPRTRFRAAESGGKRTTEILFILVTPVLSCKGGTVSSVGWLLDSSTVGTIM
jgi:hypothetical protein